MTANENSEDLLGLLRLLRASARLEAVAEHSNWHYAPEHARDQWLRAFGFRVDLRRDFSDEDLNEGPGMALYQLGVAAGVARVVELLEDGLTEESVVAQMTEDLQSVDQNTREAFLAPETGAALLRLYDAGASGSVETVRGLVDLTDTAQVDAACVLLRAGVSPSLLPDALALTEPQRDTFVRLWTEWVWSRDGVQREQLLDIARLV